MTQAGPLSSLSCENGVSRSPQGLPGSWPHPRSKSGLRGVSGETWQPPSALGPAASQGGASSHPGLPLCLWSRYLEGNFPRWQENPGGSQRRQLRQKPQVPGLAASVLLGLPLSASRWVLAFCSTVWSLNRHLLGALCVLPAGILRKTLFWLPQMVGQVAHCTKVLS